MIHPTKDGKVVVMDIISNQIDGDDTTGAVTASLPDFTNQKLWSIGPKRGTNYVLLSPDAAAGNGCMYLASSGKAKTPGGVSGAIFTESPLNITFVNKKYYASYKREDTLALITNKGNGGGVYAINGGGNPGYAIDLYEAGSTCKVRFVSHTNIPNGGWDGMTSWASPQ